MTKSASKWRTIKWCTSLKTISNMGAHHSKWVHIDCRCKSSPSSSLQAEDAGWPGAHNHLEPRLRGHALRATRRLGARAFTWEAPRRKAQVYQLDSNGPAPSKLMDF